MTPMIPYPTLAKLTLGVVLATSLVSCSDNTPTEETTPQADASETQPAEEATTEETAVDESKALQEWSIAANEIKTTLQDGIDSWEESDCNAVAVGLGDELCSQYSMILSTTAESGVLKWQGRRTESAPIYIDTIPTDIAVYVEKVDEAIDKLKASTDSLTSTCPDGDGCAGEIMSTTLSMEDTITLLDSWPN